MRDFSNMSHDAFTTVRTRFQKSVYEIYKTRWINEHETAAVEAARKEHLLYLAKEEMAYMTFDEFAATGRITTSKEDDRPLLYGEFMCFKYQDEEYMKEFLDNDELFEAYKAISAEHAARIEEFKKHNNQ